MVIYGYISHCIPSPITPLVEWSHRDSEGYSSTWGVLVSQRSTYATWLHAIHPGKTPRPTQDFKFGTICLAFIPVAVAYQFMMFMAIEESESTWTDWWFGTFFIFHNIWDNPSHWLICFKMVIAPPTRFVCRFLVIFHGMNNMVYWCLLGYHGNSWDLMMIQWDWMNMHGILIVDIHGNVRGCNGIINY